MGISIIRLYAGCTQGTYGFIMLSQPKLIHGYSSSTWPYIQKEHSSTGRVRKP